ncbi:MAG: cytochrome P450 [Acidimicrobiia bacterium]
MTDTASALDWAEDYDIFDRRFVQDPYPITAELRAHAPLAHTGRWGGSWLPTRYEDIQTIAHDVEHFSSVEITVAPIPATYDEHGNRRRSVIASDPPEHTPERRILLPFFSPKAVQRYEEGTRELCNRFIDGFIADGRVDAAERYARQLPPRIIARILGIDPDRADDFTEWVQGVLELGLTDPELREKYRVLINDFFREEIERRKTEPGDDLISWLLSQEIDGKPLGMHIVEANVSLMLIAGIDTTWSSIGSALWHLATHPEDTAKLVANPELLPNAIEEFLRAYSPVTMARIATSEVTIGGRTIQPGDRVLLAFPHANRDPEVFEDPDEVDIERQHNRHIAFGVGIHRCAGSNLARMEMRIALETWLARIPRFRLADADAVTWSGGQVRGPRHLPIVFE